MDGKQKRSKRCKEMKKISIIIPCYNEQDNIGTLYDALSKIMD